MCSEVKFIGVLTEEMEGKIIEIIREEIMTTGRISKSLFNGKYLGNIDDTGSKPGVYTTDAETIGIFPTESKSGVLMMVKRKSRISQWFTNVQGLLAVRSGEYETGKYEDWKLKDVSIL